MNEGVGLSSGAMLRESVAIFRRNWALLLVAGLVDVLLRFGQDVENRERIAGVFGVLLAAVLVIVVQIAVQGIIARSVFVREEIVDANVPARFGAYVGVSLLVLIGITCGMILLIVPGIMLALRWALAANFTLTRDRGVREAMEASRDTTDGHRGEIFGAYVVLGLLTYAPLLVLMPLAGGIRAFNSLEPWTVLGAIREAWSALMGMAALALGLGMFATFVDRHHSLREVFA